MVNRKNVKSMPQVFKEVIHVNKAKLLHDNNIKKPPTFKLIIITLN